MLSPVPPLLLQVLQMLLLTSRSVQTSRCHQPIRGQEVSVTAMFLLHVSGVGVGLFWRGEDRHSGGILQGNAAREAPLTVRAAGSCSSICSVCSSTIYGLQLHLKTTT